MGFLAEPPELSAIFDKPGKDWTEEERGKVWAWLWDKPQLPRILGFAFLCLFRTGGNAIERVHAEDTWEEFNLYHSERHKRWIYPLDGVIDSYDPAKGARFPGYFGVCFRNFCHERVARIAQEAQVVGPLDPGDEPPPSPLPVPAPAPRPPRGGGPRGVVGACIEELPEPYRAAILMYYFEEMSIAEIAKALGTTPGNVRIRLHRGRKKIQECLIRRNAPHMPPEVQAVVKLRYEKGMAIAAISLELVITEVDVHDRLLRAKGMLHVILRREGGLP